MKLSALEELKEEVTRFSNLKFGEDRPFTAPLRHMITEVHEAIANGELSEFADMQICLIDGFRLKFPWYSTDDLMKACMDKIKLMEKQNRVWVGPDENGAYQHFKNEQL